MASVGKSSRRLARRMTSQKSTGPRTPAGKLRSSKNALQHGLSIPVSANPGFEEEIEQLARLITGDDPSSLHLSLARYIAQAQIDLARIRQAKHAAFNNPSKRIKPLSAMREVRACINFLEGRRPPDVLYMITRLYGLNTDFEPVPLEEGYSAMFQELRKLERYERRALLRRGRAVLAFELAIDNDRSQVGSTKARPTNYSDRL